MRCLDEWYHAESTMPATVKSPPMTAALRVRKTSSEPPRSSRLLTRSGVSSKVNWTDGVSAESGPSSLKCCVVEYLLYNSSTT